MVSYLLLRSNKESGPYSLEELVAHGLKPYDLVWVKGKSAAWRYPSEIEELQPYSAPVEEQPFDRFYKKPDAAVVAEEEKLATSHLELARQRSVAQATPIEKPQSRAQIVNTENYENLQKAETRKEDQILKETLPEIVRTPVVEETQPVSQLHSDSKYQPKPEVETTVPKSLIQTSDINQSKARKSVFVTLPGQKSNDISASRNKVIANSKATATDEATAINKAETASTPTAGSSSVAAAASSSAATSTASSGIKASSSSAATSTAHSTVSLKESAPVAEIKYSQPLDEIKEMYVRTLQERKSKSARNTIIKSYLQKAAVVAGLVGVGVLAGFIMKPKSRNANIAQATPKVVTSSPIAIQQVQDSEAGPLPEGNTSDDSDKGEDIILPAARHVEIVVPVKQKPERPITGQVTSNQEVSLPKPQRDESSGIENEKRDFESKKLFVGSEKNPTTGERTRVVRDESSSKETNTTTVSPVTKVSGSSGLASQVNVKSNDYKIVAFGGIRDLRLTVTNNSKYELDNVIVELQYLKPSEQPLRTERIEFKFIAPNESSTIRVPDTNRGIKVAYKIVSIGSKQNRDAVAGM